MRVLPCPVTAFTAGLVLGFCHSATAGESAAETSSWQGGQEIRLDALTLEDALILAVRENFAIRRARESISFQRARVSEARGLLLPQVTAQGSASTVEESRVANFGPLVTQDLDDWRVTMEAAQTIFAGGSNWNTLKRELELLAQSSAQLRAEMNNTVFNVKQLFYDVLLNETQIVVQEQLLELRQSEFQDAEDRLDAGVGSNFEALRAKVAVANAKPDLIRARNSYKVNLERLREAMGLRNVDTSRMQLIGELQFEAFPISSDDALATAFGSRPELIAFQAAVQAGERNVKVEKGQLLPRIEIYANYGFFRAPEATEADVLDGFEIGVRSTWNIWSGGSRRARVSQAKSDVRDLKLQLDELLLNIEVDVRDAWLSLQDAVELVKASEEVVVEAEESLRLAQARFDVGASTQLDVLDAQVSLTEARTNRIQALRDYNVAVASLQTQMGEFSPEIMTILEAAFPATERNLRRRRDSAE